MGKDPSHFSKIPRGSRQAAQDMDERYYTDFTNPAMLLVLRMYSLKHYWSPSRLTLLAYHHFGATPLMLFGGEGRFGLRMVPTPTISCLCA